MGMFECYGVILILGVEMASGFLFVKYQHITY